MRYGVFLLLAAATPAAGQTRLQLPQGWSLAAYGGGAAFTAFQRSTVTAPASGSSGNAESREIGRRVGAKTAGAFALGVGYWPSDRWGIRLYGAYSPTRFETMSSDGAQLDSAESSALAPLTILSVDAQFMLRLPTIRRLLMPYGFVGTGLVRYTAETGAAAMPSEAVADFSSGTRVKPAVRIGVGTMLPLASSGWGLNFELNDHIARTPIESGGDRSVRTTSSLSFMVGLSWLPGGQ